MIEIFTMPNCPVCDRVKKMLSDKGEEVKEIPIENLIFCDDWREENIFSKRADCEFFGIDISIAPVIFDGVEPMCGLDWLEKNK